MIAKPWLEPELTSVNRLPMHSVPHLDRVGLDGRWRFQLLHTPEEPLAATWAEVDVPGCWTMQDTWDLPHYTNVQMPFSGQAPELPATQPTGVYERDFDLDAAWLENRRIVLHVGAAESVLIAAVNGQEVGVGKDSHLASEFDVTELVRPGANSVSLRVVKWSDATYIEDQDQWWHGGITRSVFLYATPRVHLADLRVNAGLADDLRTGTFELLAEVDFDGLETEIGWTVEARLGELRPLIAAGSVCQQGDRTGESGGLGAVEPASVRHGRQLVSVGLSGADEAEWQRLAPQMRPPLDGRAEARLELPDVRIWSAEQPNLYPLHVTLRSPAGDVDRGGGPARRLPSRRDRGRPPAHQRQAGAAARRQPPRLRPAHRPRDLGRVHPRGSGPDEAVRLQRAAHVALPQRPSPARRGRRVGPVRDRRGRHRVACLHRAAVRRPALPQRLGGARCPAGPARQEPRFGHRLVARQRVRPRGQPRRRGGLHPTLRPVAAASL